MKRSKDELVKFGTTMVSSIKWARTITRDSSSDGQLEVDFDEVIGNYLCTAND